MDLLPAEVLLKICGQIKDTVDLRSMRFVNKSCAAAASEHIHVVYCRSSDESLTALRERAKNPFSQKHIDTLVLDPSVMPVMNYHNWRRLQIIRKHALEGHSTNEVFPGHLVDPSTMPHVSWHASWRKYRTQLDAQARSVPKSIPNHMRGVFEALPQMRHIIVTGNSHELDTVNTSNVSSVRLCQPEDVRDTLLALLESAKTSTHILISITALHFWPKFRTLSETSTFSHAVKNLQSIRLTLAMCNWTPRGRFKYKRHSPLSCVTPHELYIPLANAKKLEELKVSLAVLTERRPFGDYHSYFALDYILGPEDAEEKTHFPSLKVLNLSRFVTADSQLLSFLLRHAATLETVILGSAWMIGSTWKHFFTSLRQACATTFPKLKVLECSGLFTSRTWDLDQDCWADEAAEFAFSNISPLPLSALGDPPPDAFFRPLRPLCEQLIAPCRRALEMRRRMEAFVLGGRDGAGESLLADLNVVYGPHEAEWYGESVKGYESPLWNDEFDMYFEF